MGLVANSAAGARGGFVGWGPMAYTLEFLGNLSVAGALFGCVCTLLMAAFR